MTLSQWFLFFLILQVVHFAGTWKLYKKAGRKSWEAAIPVYNAVVLMKIINRSPWWTILLFVPVVNLIMFPVVWVETLRSFGKNTTTDTLLGLFTFGLYIYYINYAVDVKYVANRSLKARTTAGDTVSSFLFAIVVATLVHTYVIQPFTIPTSSLEKTLLVGDFLFVSKYNYGARVPMTTVAAPMVHDTIPFFKTKSYLPWPQGPYWRFPGYESIHNNDIVVFNWPVDTVVRFFDRNSPKVWKPIDKRSNYVKRCIGIAGDNIVSKDGILFVNGKEVMLPERARPQFSYTAVTSGEEIDQRYLISDLGITDRCGYIAQDSFYLSAASEEAVARLRKNPAIKSITKNIIQTPDPRIFPYSKNWSVDNFGPVHVPKEGETLKLNAETLPFYKRAITEYEGNTLEVKDGSITVNGKPADSYTFKQDYFWMMGDNRHNSEDSRYWGFVPEDHIVGKPIFIWFSEDPNIPMAKLIDKIRWDRMFTTVGGNGQPFSYFPYFVILLAIYWIGNFFYKRKKRAA